MAQIISEVLGKPVRFQRLPIEPLKARLQQAGMSEGMLQDYLAMWAAYEQGLATSTPRTPEATTATSFRQWCKEVLKPAVLA